MTKIAIVGATGNVGTKILEVLDDYNLPIDALVLYASKRSAGKTVMFRGKPYEIQALSEASIDETIDYALFSAGANIAKQYAPLFTQREIRVIDNSSAWRMHENIPLIVPEINANRLTKANSLIANPNCSTIQSVIPLAIIDELFGLKRVNYTTYQAVSGSGQAGIEDLKQGIKGDAPKTYPKAIFDNVLPHIDYFHDDGYTNEEHKMIDETRKILNKQTLPVSATCVRVPVFNGHAVAITLECEQPIDIKTLNKALSSSPGIQFFENETYPTPQDANGQDDVFVGRIRKDTSHSNGLHLWCVADNLRKGAASNAVQILKHLMEGTQ